MKIPVESRGLRFGSIWRAGETKIGLGIALHLDNPPSLEMPSTCHSSTRRLRLKPAGKDRDMAGHCDCVRVCALSVMQCAVSVPGVAACVPTEVSA